MARFVLICSSRSIQQFSYSKAKALGLKLSLKATIVLFHQLEVVTYYESIAGLIPTLHRSTSNAHLKASTPQVPFI
jgi:hypothetical protein